MQGLGFSVYGLDDPNSCDWHQRRLFLALLLSGGLRAFLHLGFDCFLLLVTSHVGSCQEEGEEDRLCRFCFEGDEAWRSEPQVSAAC